LLRNSFSCFFDACADTKEKEIASVKKE